MKRADTDFDNELFYTFNVESSEELSKKIRENLSEKFPHLRIVEQSSLFYSDRDDYEERKGMLSDTFFLEYPIDSTGMHLMSVIKIPNQNALSVRYLHNEANTYGYINNSLDCLPHFYGFNSSAEILHTGFLYSDIESCTELCKRNPVQMTASALESLQQLHKRGIIHNDLYLWGNMVFTHIPGGQLKAFIIDLGLSEVYTHNNESFDRERREDIKGIVSMLPNALMVNDSSLLYSELEKALETYGLSPETAHNIYELTRLVSDYIPSISEVDELIMSLRILSENNPPPEIRLINQNELGFADGYKKAMQEIMKVNKFLMTYEQNPFI